MYLILIANKTNKQTNKHVVAGTAPDRTSQNKRKQFKTELVHFESSAAVAVAKGQFGDPKWESPPLEGGKQRLVRNRTPRSLWADTATCRL
jgi:hypothetical protein